MNFAFIRVRGDIKGVNFNQLKDNEAYVDIDITLPEAQRLVKILTHYIDRGEKNAKAI